MPRQCPEGLTPVARWLQTHPYLEELARLHERVQDTLQSITIPVLPEPQWENHAEELQQGIPLLLSRNLDPAFIRQAGEVLCQLFERLSSTDMPERFRMLCAQYREQLLLSPETARLLVETQFAGPKNQEEADSPEQGFLHFFCWMAIKRVLLPWHEAFENWRQEFPWEHPYCPLCGAHPAMAQLLRTRGGRRRMLSCGCCGIRWSYFRLGCPFCGNEDHGQLSILEPEEEGFRIDVCHQCRGFLKTYTDEGEEPLMLADWSTLHLDALGLQQGYRRLAQSLYGL